MKTVRIDLPDALADEAAEAGLLASPAVELMLRQHLRDGRVNRLREALGSLPTEAAKLSVEADITAEIAAYRYERRHAAGS